MVMFQIYNCRLPRIWVYHFKERDCALGYPWSSVTFPWIIHILWWDYP